MNVTIFLHRKRTRVKRRLYDPKRGKIKGRKGALRHGRAVSVFALGVHYSGTHTATPGAKSRRTYSAWYHSAHRCMGGVSYFFGESTCQTAGKPSVFANEAAVGKMAAFAISALERSAFCGVSHLPGVQSGLAAEKAKGRTPNGLPPMRTSI